MQSALELSKNHGFDSVLDKAGEQIGPRFTPRILPPPDVPLDSALISSYPGAALASEPGQATESDAGLDRAPVAILGVSFDNVTLEETVVKINEMIEARQPHYVVTANVDFLVQAQKDEELRHVLLNADLVLCDGQPLVWASRFLGNSLPERVAGADLVPRLLVESSTRGHSVFFLGATPESAAQAVARLRRQHPGLIIAGHYSPPFGSLLEMDNQEIQRRIRAARPDLLLVAFGCPKAEKWIAMHYQLLDVPVVIGVGATIDFLSGQVRRAPRWMQKAGMEWIFRMAQEPRRLFRRYTKDLGIFGWSLFRQLWCFWPENSAGPKDIFLSEHLCYDEDSIITARLTGPLDGRFAQRIDSLAASGRDCVIDLSMVESIDSSGLATLIVLQKKLRARGRRMAVVAISAVAKEALVQAKLEKFFESAPDDVSARALLEKRKRQAATVVTSKVSLEARIIEWHGEITVENAAEVWLRTATLMDAAAGQTLTIDLSEVRFIDTLGAGTMLRLQQFARRKGKRVAFTNPTTVVRNVLRTTHQLDQLLLEKPELQGLVGCAFETLWNAENICALASPPR